ncbi:CcdC family protein [Cytobacillus sp. Hz8]|uniref:CcdC family protein n=1 Tax=Cytobacillus sp. Hz8 TaxID=3347168 RepID=UPI0035E0D3BE
MNMVVITSIGAICMAVLVMFIRMKASKKPASAKKIILPPIFMSTGASMFLIPTFRVTGMELAEAVIAGILFSIFLIKTSNFEIVEDQIFLKRSRAFIFILIGLLVIRIIGKLALSTSIDYGQLSGMFFILAFSMILPWRVAMYVNYRKLYLEMMSRTRGMETV